MSRLNKSKSEYSQFRSGLCKFAWSVCLVVVCLVIGGCGRSPDLASQDEIDNIKAERRKKSAKEGMAYQESVAEKRKAQAEAKNKIERKRQALLAQKKKSTFSNRRKKIKRPKDVAAWKKRDYYEAKVEGDSRLREAVEYLGNEFVGDVHAGRLLKELLLPGLPPGMSDIKVKASRGSGNILIESLVKALVKNRTRPAFNALTETVLQQQPANNATVAHKVLLCLAETPDKQTELIILEALLHPPKSADKGHNSSPARRRARNTRGTRHLAKVAQAAMTNGASEEFRVQLARRIVDHGLPLEYSELYSGLLLEPWPKNLNAQIVLFDDLNASEQRLKRLQKQWAAHSSQALRRLYGLGPTSQNAVPQGTVYRDNGKRLEQTHMAAANDSRLVERVMEKLWCKKPTDQTDDRLYRSASLDDGAATILLAATMPRDSVRKSLHDVITRNWQDGPKALNEVGLFESITCEPGFWLVLKSCRFAPSGTGDKKTKSTKKRRIHQQMQQDPWQMPTVKMLLANCNSMEKAAAAQRLLSWHKGIETPKRSLANDFPIEPHDNARLVAEYRLVWPEQIKNAQPELLPDTTKLWYAKFHQTAVFEKMVTQYHGRMNTPRQHLGPKGCWLESLSPVEGTNRLRSIDVVIRRTPSTVQLRTGAPERLLIDILAVEVKNPAGK